MRQYRKKLIALLLCVVIALSGSIPVFAKTSKRTVKIAFPLQSGMTEIAKDGTYQGYTYDYIKKLAQFAGWNVECVKIEEDTLDASILKAMEMVKNNEIDLIGCMNKVDSLLDSYLFSSSAYGMIYTTLAVRYDNQTLNEYTFLNAENLKIGVSRNAVRKKAQIDSYLKEKGIRYSFVECDDVQQSYDLLQDGKVDMIADVSTSNFANVRHVAQFSPTPFYFATAIGNDALLAELNDAIKELTIHFPTYGTDLMAKYFSPSLKQFYLSAEEKEYLAKKKSMRVLCVVNNAPFIFIDSNGNLNGISIKLCNSFCEKTGLTVQYDIYDITAQNTKSLSELLESSNYDCVLGLPSNMENSDCKNLISSSPYFSTEYVLYSKLYQKTKSFETATMAVPTGLVLDNTDYKKILYFDTLEECVKAVNDGRADYGYGNRYSVEYYSRSGLENLSIVPLAVNEKSLSVWFPNESDHTLLFLVNRDIAALDSSQIYLIHSQILNESVPYGLMAYFMANPAVAIFWICLFAFLVLLFIILLLMLHIIRQKNVKLVQESNAKRSFLTKISHDMRTPMNSILSFSRMALDEEESPATLREDMKKINFSGTYLLNLINDILDVSKLESDQLKLNPVKTDTDTIRNSVLTIITPMMEKSKIDFHYEATWSTAPRWIMADPVRLQQIFVNLLSNAAKFTPEGGRVDCLIQSTELPDKKLAVAIIIRDTGIGMSEAFQKHAFESFSQEQENCNGKLQGSGLGLSIVKRIVDLMGGTISLKSARNQGTEFLVELSFEITEPVCEIDSDSRTVEDILKGKRVLLCEDHPLNLEVAKRLLAKKDILVETAENGQLGLTLFKDSALGYYDAIIMDIMMPVMDGLEATKAIRSLDRPDAKTVPIIAMTANAFSEDVASSLENGMNAHISKPIAPNSLYTVLARQMDCKRAEPNH